MSIPTGPFRNFWKFRGDIRSSRGSTGVIDTGAKWKKSSIRKILMGSKENRSSIDNFFLQVHFKVKVV
jgi:hypothetical protein